MHFILSGILSKAKFRNFSFLTRIEFLRTKLWLKLFLCIIPVLDKLKDDQKLIGFKFLEVLPICFKEQLLQLILYIPALESLLLLSFLLSQGY